MVETYKPSEKIAADGLLISLVFTPILALLYGIMYGLYCAYSPLLYLGIFITILCGTTFGYACIFIAKISRLRSKKKRMQIALLSMGLMYFIHWGFYILTLLKTEQNPDFYENNLDLFLYPKSMLSIIKHLYINGAWSIGSIEIKQFPLLLVWIFEIFILFLVPYLVIKKYPISPYSEDLNKWYECFDLYKDFESIYDVEHTKLMLSEDSKNTIDSFTHGSPRNFAKISIYYLEHEKRQYLSIFNVKSSAEGKNVKQQEVIHLLQITSEESQYLIKKYHAKKRFYFDY